MPTLSNIQGGSLVANLDGLLRGVEHVGERFREESKLQELENLALTAQGQTPTPSSGPLDFLSQIAPDMADTISNLTSARSQPTADTLTNIDRTRARATSNLKVADTILGTDDPVAKSRAIREDAERVRREGGDVSNHLRMINMSPDEQNLQAEKAKLTAQNVIKSLPAPTAQERKMARIRLNVRAPQVAASLRAGEQQRFNMARARAADARAARAAAAAEAAPRTELGRNLANIRRDIQRGAISEEVGNAMIAQARQAAAPAPTPQTDLGQNLAAISADVQSGAITPEVGNVLIERAQSAATTSAAPKFQTPLGKLIGDQQAVNQTFGKNSPQARAINSALNSEVKGEGPKLTDVAGVRKEFTKLSGDFIAVRDAFSKIQQGTVGEPTGAKDIGMIINYMKMLDPGSVVRETEFDTVRRAQGLGGVVGNFASRVLTGQVISPNLREQLQDAAGGIMSSAAQNQTINEQQFRGLAERLGMKPDNVVIDFRAPDKTPKGEVRTTKSGRRFRVVD